MLDLILEAKVRPDLQNEDSSFNCELCGEVLVAKNIQANRTNNIKTQFNHETEKYLNLLTACISKVHEAQRQAVLQEERRLKFGSNEPGSKIQQYKAKAITHMNQDGGAGGGKLVLPHLARFNVGKDNLGADGKPSLAPLAHLQNSRGVMSLDPEAFKRELEIQRKVEERVQRERKEEEQEDPTDKIRVMVKGEAKLLDDVDSDDFEEMTEAEYKQYIELTRQHEDLFMDADSFPP